VHADELRVVVVAAAFWLLTATAVAQAKVTLHITPKKPTTVDDSVVE
jgi:hypothetical protein